MILSCQNISKSFGTTEVLKNASFHIEAHEKAALIGINGAGKSTMLKIIMRDMSADEGEIVLAKDTSIGYLSQHQDIKGARSIYEEVLSARQNLIEMEAKIRSLETQMKNASQRKLEKLMAEYTRLNQSFEMHNGYAYRSEVTGVLKGLGFEESEFTKLVSTLSGGQKTRVALGKLLITKPDIILLDEPTNHLDMASINWLETYLINYPGAVLIVSHDRYFLDRVATRIVELVNGQFYSYQGGYSDFIVAKAEREHAEDEEESRRQSFLRSEVEWVRRSPKARLKRNMGRVKRFDAIADSDAPARDRDINLIIPPASRLGNKTVELKNISLAFGDNVLFSDFNHEFIPGSRTGIVGPNGCGKTSLLKLITGQLQPSSGTIETAATIQFNYIDQNRITLNLQNTVFEEIGEGNQTTQVGDQRISVWTYLNRFLFS